MYRSATRPVCERRSLPIGLAGFPPDNIGERVEGALVALRSQPADHPGRRQAYIGMMPKALATENIRQVHLDDRQFGGEKRVEHRYRGVGQRPRIENDSVGRFARLLDPVDELALVIGLPELDLEVEGCGAGQAPLLDIG